MAALPSVTLSATLKLEPQLKKHPPTDKSPSISYQRSAVNTTQLDGSLEPIRAMDFEEALCLIKDQTKFDSSCYVPLLRECIYKNSVSDAQLIHAHMVKTGTHKEFALISYLVNVYAKCGSMGIARKVFDELPRRNVVVWTALMTGYIHNSQPDLAIQVFINMLEAGSFPSTFTLGVVLNACSSLNSIQLAKQLHAFIFKYKNDYDSSIGNALCSLYSKFSSLESALLVFRSIQEKNVISWSAVISACGENSEASMGLRFFVEMLLQDIEPNEFTLTTVLSLCCVMLALGLGRQVHSLSIKLGYQSNQRIMNSVMYLYLKCGCIDEAHKLFNKMESTNLVTWNAMIAGYAQAMDLAKDDFSVHQSGTEALRIFLKLNRTDMKPDLFTLSSMFTVCSRLLALEQGEQFHAHTVKSGFLSDVVVGTALVNMYGKCGNIQGASRAFVEMSKRTLISWTSMITTFAQHGQSQRALELFEDMRLAGFRPNQVTFVGVLAACCNAGMVDEALAYFEIMQKEYRIKPVMDHYGCLISMFVKLGRLDEAFDVIKKMDFEPNELIWSVLIVGCRLHGKQELGFYAAEQLLKMKPNDVETYVKLLNMYISAERWEDVSRVRKLMKEEKIGKLKDWSWINIKDKVHSFKTKRQLHGQNTEMHMLLEELHDKAKHLGYELPKNTEAIVDYEEEDDDEKTFPCVIYHSERLAIAFGLLNAKKDVPIRITKTVSMCRNCHDFVKVLSLLCSREFIIRDSRHLHKFAHGRCSCADFL
ncbi:pentatricopeptide repeat-containing protein At3g12770-like [Euphorbia lathyris]|uniref:pentatricopeptide repeat-containing protein At3g12770-like n=1 Tax=Euphorbia lathyris TaxID=212925 RepID=UPI003313B472